MIMIAVLIIVCCPLIYFCGLFRRNRQVAADKQILKNLKKLNFDDFIALKRHYRAQRVSIARDTTMNEETQREISNDED